MNNSQLESIKSLKLYIIQDGNGKFYFSHKKWVDDANKAKIFNKIGPARGAVTFFAKRRNMVKLIELGIGTITILDEEKRVNNVLKKEEERVLANKISVKQRRLEEARQEFLNALNTFKQLTESNNDQ